MKNMPRAGQRARSRSKKNRPRSKCARAAFDQLILPTVKAKVYTSKGVRGPLAHLLWRLVQHESFDCNVVRLNPKRNYHKQIVFPLEFLGIQLTVNEAGVAGL